MGERGPRIIIVEDEALLVLEMESLVEDLGYSVVGTASSIDQATELARTTDYDVALLDMNICGARIDPVARLVAERGRSIIFVTGYGQRTLPPGIAAPVIDKPCSAAKLKPLLAAWKG